MALERKNVCQGGSWFSWNVLNEMGGYQVEICVHLWHPLKWTMRQQWPEINLWIWVPKSGTKKVVGFSFIFNQTWELAFNIPLGWLRNESQLAEVFQLELIGGGGLLYICRQHTYTCLRPVRNLLAYLHLHETRFCLSETKCICLSASLSDLLVSEAAPTRSLQMWTVHHSLQKKKRDVL